MKTIMIVDDDKIIRDITPEILETAGYQVMEVDSGENCLSTVNTIQPDLIILDSQMPLGIDRIEIFKRLGTDIPVIFYSRDDQHWHACLTLGAFDFVTKPSGRQDLIDIVKAALQLSLGKGQRVAKLTFVTRSN